MDCGCTYTRVMGDTEIVYCSLHQAAERMQMALAATKEQMIDQLPVDCGLHHDADNPCWIDLTLGATDAATAAVEARNDTQEAS